MTMDYTYLPAHMQEGAKRYVEHGTEPGDFLRAVLENNLLRAFERADAVNSSYMKEWALFLYHAPRACWGSRETVNKWVMQGGLNGHIPETL